MRHVLIFAARAEIPDEQAHGISGAFDPPVGPARPRRCRQQMPVGPGRIGIGDHDDRRRRSRPDASRTPQAAPSLTMISRTSWLQSTAPTLPFDQLHQTVDQAPGAAHRKMHAPAPFQEGDQAIDRACGKRVAADQQRMEAEHDAQPGIAKEFRDQAVDAAIARQPDHLGRDPRHVGPFAERHVAELFESDLEDLLAGLHVAVVAADIAGRKSCDLRAHGGRIAGVIEVRAVLKADPVERRHRHQRHVVGQFASAQLPQFLEQERRGDDGRTGIEGEAVLPVDVSAAAGRIEFFQHGDAIAFRAEPNRRRQSAEAAADHHRMRMVILISWRRTMGGRIEHGQYCN